MDFYYHQIKMFKEIYLNKYKDIVDISWIKTIFLYNISNFGFKLINYLEKKNQYKTSLINNNISKEY